jgi:glycerol-3-phosphate dehydrogenase
MSAMKIPVYDIAIIGGGINGCGIARDAAGRGLSIFLCEKDDLATRLFRTYGSCAYEMTGKIKDDLGTLFGHNLYAFEVDYLIACEWAKSAEDVLWQRTKLGLFLSAAEADKLDGYIKKKVSVENKILPIPDEEK